MMRYKNITTLKEHKAAIYSLCKGEENHIFFSGGSDQYVIQWNLKSLEAEKVVAKSPTTIISLFYEKEHNLLFIGQVEGGVHVIDLTEGKEIKYLQIHKGYIFNIQYIKEKKEIIFSSGDGEISIWSMPEFKLLFRKKIGNGKNRKMAFSFERKELAIASADGFVQVLNTEDWSDKYKVEGLESGANSLVYHNNSLLIGTKNAHLHVFDLISMKKKEAIPAHNWAIYDIVTTSNTNTLATASRDKTVKIWDAKSMSVLKRFEGIEDQGHINSVNSLLWTNHDDFLLSAGDDRTIKVWQIG